ncbi:hypothetical protein MCEMRE182_00103 [Candidatus Nanopelagicaceae bacterium]
MKKKIFVLVGIAMATLIMPPELSAGAENTLDRAFIDPTIPQVAPMVYCKIPSQLDCVERVVIEHPDGTVEDAKYIDTRIVNFPDSEGQKVTYGDILFDFHNEKNSGSLKRLRISTHVQTPLYSTNGKKWAVYWLMLQREARPGETLGVINKCDGTSASTCITYPALDTEDRFNMYFRTSWLKPVAGGGEGVGAFLEHQRIPGGMRWKFSGGEFLQPGFKTEGQLQLSATPGGQNLKPDLLNPTLYAVIDHAGKDMTDSYWDPKCADYGFTLTVDNAPMAGQLYWDAASESLIFNIFGPHLDAFGRLNRGYFHTRFQQAWLDCRFPGNTLSTATKITVQVLDEDGVPQVSTSSTSIQNGIIDITATGFHFSSPKVVTKKSADSQLSSSYLTTKYPDDWNDTLLSKVVQLEKKQDAAKPSTILCIKGSLTKRITALKPVCPKGYKKK